MPRFSDEHLCGRAAMLRVLVFALVIIRRRRRIKAFAEVAGLFYNDVFQDQLESLASDLESLAKQRANSRRVCPLVMLSVAYEALMNKFIVQLRSQAMELLFQLEHMQK